MAGGSTPRCSPRSDRRQGIDRTSTSAARRRSSRLSRARSSNSATSLAAYEPSASDPLEDEMRLDGNAAAGILRQVFAVEMTEAIGTCEGCGKAEAVGALLLYDPAPGTRLPRPPPAPGVSKV